jgi:hypothetical protein
VLKLFALEFRQSDQRLATYTLVNCSLWSTEYVQIFPYLNISLTGPSALEKMRDVKLLIILTKLETRL